MRNSAQVPGFQSHTLFKTETKKKALKSNFLFKWPYKHTDLKKKVRSEKHQLFIQCLFSISTASCKKHGLKHKLCLTGLAHPSPSHKFTVVAERHYSSRASQPHPFNVPFLSCSCMYMHARRSITDASSQFVLMDPFPTSSVKLLFWTCWYCLPHNIPQQNTP